MSTMTQSKSLFDFPNNVEFNSKTLFDIPNDVEFNTKTLFDIINGINKPFKIQMFKNDNSQYIISFVIEDKIYSCTLPDAKEVKLNEKCRDINSYPLFRMLIQSIFQLIADHLGKKRFKNQYVSKITGKMWHSSKAFQREFQNFTNEVNLLRPKPQFGFRPSRYDPHPIRDRSNRNDKKSKISIVPSFISVRHVQQDAGSSSELAEFYNNGSSELDVFNSNGSSSELGGIYNNGSYSEFGVYNNVSSVLGEFYNNGSEWPNHTSNKNNTVDCHKQDDSLSPPTNESLALSNNYPFDPLALGFEGDDFNYILDFLEANQSANVPFGSMQYVNSSNFNNNYGPVPQYNVPHSNFPASLDIDDFGQNGQNGQLGHN
ncbi:4429_t:CDS:1 [Racocetra fulgida]|uniref:4429_t:CDS:1 n=1 Tax=Racocetra fulgida TaxID=60492 RepID=A0A9N8VJM7_9GLOM|nr:4429_t:CDS:1 [Racocetra fulgida]